MMHAYMMVTGHDGPWDLMNAHLMNRGPGNQTKKSAGVSVFASDLDGSGAGRGSLLKACDHAGP